MFAQVQYIYMGGLNMPTDEMKVLREKSLMGLKNFPKVLESHWELVEYLECVFKFKKGNKPSQMLREWEDQDVLEKFYFLGWMRSCIKKMGVTKAIRFILLRDKQKIEAALATILDGAEESERKAFTEGEDSIK